jgi:ATP-dependent phosphofructokinase / diphosphate-dependent phosphofructokinase
MVTVSEGARMLEGEILERGEADAYGHRKLGGIGRPLIRPVDGRPTFLY